ncbi:MAG: hypothetical protein JWN03_5965 [Nocardia sp.]|uniref:hypothetical protein n=1 Tax=Nocardia sp. TaxID=1821 RepID=UPI00261E138B|nr:hypothetical protein [Nocardia sp.]MCU1645690.1 hypothetical protein [Nocardia sp.]
MQFCALRYQLGTTILTGAAILALGAAGAAGAAPPVLGAAPSYTAPADSDGAPSGMTIALGTGSSSLSANPGSATGLASGSGSLQSDSAAGGPPGTGSGNPTSSSSNFGNKLGTFGPNLAAGIDNLMRALGFRPGAVPTPPGCPEAGQTPHMRGLPGYDSLLDPGGTGISCS